MSKLYYSSSEVSTMLDLEPSVLRFWEDQFSQLRIKRNRAGKRMYREKDIELIRTIKRLTRDEGYTIAGARKKLQESAAARSAEKAAATAEKPVPAAKAAPDAAQADHGADQAAPDAAQADPGAAQADRGDQKAASADTASQTELIQWIRSRLIEIRDSMD